MTSNGSALDTVASPAKTQNWTLDALSNWTGFNDSTTTNQTRTFNARNEIATISGGNSTSTPMFDHNGNMTQDELGHKYVFDAWNRIVKVEDSSSNVLETYSYDAFGRRITETPTGGTTKDLFYNTAGNVIEEQQAGVTTDQYVWGLGGQDSLVLRDDNSSSGSYGKTGSGLGERLFIQQDPNGSVTSLVDTSGTVKERFVYDPYGAVTVVDPTNWNQTTDSYNWLYKFQGGRQDPVSGLVHFGTPGRDYSTTLGRWAQVDRSGYIAGANLYAADGSNPASYADPGGADPVFGLAGGVAEGSDGSDLGDSGGGEVVNNFASLLALGRSEYQSPASDNSCWLPGRCRTRRRGFGRSRRSRGWSRRLTGSGVRDSGCRSGSPPR